MITSPDSSREREKTTINKVHFLAHPGWIFEDNPFAKLHYGAIELKDKYIKRAGELKDKPNELMVAFAPAYRREICGSL